MAVLSIAKTVATSSPVGPSLEGVGADTGAEVVITGAGVGLTALVAGVGSAVAGAAVAGLPVGADASVGDSVAVSCSTKTLSTFGPPFDVDAVKRTAIGPGRQVAWSTVGRQIVKKGEKNRMRLV